MKRNINKFLLACLVGCGVAATMTSCKNGEADFPDYEEGTTAYFAYQYPVRTIVLGDDEYDVSLDHAHKCQIKATFGGSRSGSDGSVQVAVDPTLVDKLTFETGGAVKAMPTDYYTLSTTNLAFNGTYYGTTEVQLTDAFFNDPDAVKETYVIPLVITGQNGFSRILTGTLKEGGQPVRTDASQWEIKPMDYVLYCVKYQNKFSGYWLTNHSTSIDNIEKAANYQIVTKSLTTSIYHAEYTTHDFWQYKKDDKGNVVKDANGNEVFEQVTKTFPVDLQLVFDANDNCTITSASAGITATGSGKWTDNGAKKSWNNKDRDLIELTYKVDFNVTDDKGNAVKADVAENLVWLRSDVKTTEFSPVYTK